MILESIPHCVRAHAGINGRCRNALVSKHLLDDIDIHILLRHVGTHGASDIVKTNILDASCPSDAAPGLVDVDHVMPRLRSWQKVWVAVVRGDRPHNFKGWFAEHRDLLFA